MRPTVLIVDDHAEFRASAAELLETESFDVVGAAGDAAAAALRGENRTWTRAVRATRAIASWSAGFMNASDGQPCANRTLTRIAAKRRGATRQNRHA